jgi:hypothetical protein
MELGTKAVVALLLLCWACLAAGRESTGGSVAGGTHHSVNHQKHQHHHSHLQTCSRIAEEFSANSFGPASMVPESPIHGTKMEICYSGDQDGSTRSCCTGQMETKYQSAAEKDFYETMKFTSAYLRDLIADNMAFYQAQFLTLLEEAENRTGMLFDTESYHIPVAERHGAIEGLFLDLAAYIRRRDVNVHDSVSQFFDELFPMVYHYILNDPSSLILTEEYKECLTEIRHLLSPHPFGEVPHQLAHQLSKSVGAARTFLEALSLGIEVINTTDHLPLEPQCQKALTRLRYCSHCQGHVDVRPCRNYCYNVLRGCLATVGEVDRHWDEFVDAVHALTVNMRGAYNIEYALREFPSRISEAIMHSLESTHKFYVQVLNRCGQPKALPGSAQPVQKEKPVSAAVSDEGTVTQLHPKMETFMRSLLASKGFYRNLADTVCSTEKFGTGLDQERCWTGSSLGRYVQNLTEVGLDVQIASNPEVKVTGLHGASVTTLIDKLQHVIKLLKSKVSSESMQSDTWYKYYGLGSGDGGTQSDDEDFADFSASGSGYPDETVPGGKRPGYDQGVNDEIFIVESNSAESQNPGSSESRSPAPSIRPSFILLLISALCLGMWVNG